MALRGQAHLILKSEMWTVLSGFEVRFVLALLMSR